MDNIISPDVRAKEERNLAAALLESREARLFCGLLLEESGFLCSSMRDTSVLTAFAEGQRLVGQRVFELLWHVSDEAPLKCMVEYGEFAAWMSAVSASRREDEGDE